MEKHGYDWIIMPQAYFCAAKMVLVELQKNYCYLSGNKYGTDPLGFSSGSIFKKYGFPGHPNYELIYPAVYNFKHGIEMYSKSINGSNSGGHDLNSLAAMAGVSKQVKDIIKKYTNGQFQDLLETDTKNEVGRYPETKNGVSLARDRFEWVSKQVVDDMIKDIDLLQEELRKTWINRT